MAVDPAPCRWSFPPPESADDQGLVGLGADLEPGTLLAAYRAGIFPMPARKKGVIGWLSPDPRGVIPLDGLKISKSLRRSCRRYEVRVDTAFAEVLDACGAFDRPHGWIDDQVRTAYNALHALGWAHSVEAWDLDDGSLAGGLYGVAIGGLFAGESMFHHRADASKVALVGLVEQMVTAGHEGRLLDVQWVTLHLETLGAIAIPRERYLSLLAGALTLPPPAVFA